VLGGLGFVLGAFMLGAFLFVDDLGLAFSADNPTPYAMVVGTIIFGAVVYWLMRSYKARQGINVGYAFAEIPPE
jgi:hypothetical protein